MGMFDGISSALGDIAAVALAPETGGASLMALAPSVIGATGSYFGQQSANQANIDIANATSAANANLQAQTQGFNAAEAQKNRDFQAQQRETQYQTAVKDMMAAGLNPMLAYQQGGAGTPSGSAASSTASHAVQAAPMQNKMSGAAASAQQIAQTINTIQQNNLLKAQANQADSQADLNNAHRANALAENPYITQKERNIIAQTEFYRAQARLASAQQANVQQEFRLKTPEEIKSAGAWGKYISPYLKDVGTAFSAFGRLK